MLCWSRFALRQDPSERTVISLSFNYKQNLVSTGPWLHVHVVHNCWWLDMQFPYKTLCDFKHICDSSSEEYFVLSGFELQRLKRRDVHSFSFMTFPVQEKRVFFTKINMCIRLYRYIYKMYIKILVSALVVILSAEIGTITFHFQEA